MKISEKKAYVFNELTPVLERIGYELIKTTHDPRYAFKNKEYIAFVFFNFLSTGNISFSKMRISIIEIENIIIEVKNPNSDYTKYKDNTKYFLETVDDKNTLLPYSVSGDNYNLKASTVDDVKKAIEWMKSYFFNEGKGFIEKFSYPPNILHEMDRLELAGINWNNPKKGGILAGTLSAYFRGLIISKLCNDPNFSNKLLKMDEKFRTPGYEAWMPYYEKLKERLNVIEPKYSLS